MKKIFDLTTLLIIVGFAFLAYIGYHNFYLGKKEANTENFSPENQINENHVPKVAKVNPSLIGKRGEDVFSTSEDSKPLTEAEVRLTETGIKIINEQTDEPTISETEAEIPSKIQLPPIEEERTPKDPTIPENKLIPEKVEEEETEPEIPTTPGFYENFTYNYKFSYPTDWPIKIRREENISVGTIPPQNGWGAITVEVAVDMDNEIEQAKEEAGRYPGLITIKEIPIIIGGTPGTKMTLYNSTNNLTDVYIYLKKNNYYYAIKYSEESTAFVAQAEKALSSFSFTK